MKISETAVLRRTTTHTPGREVDTMVTHADIEDAPVRLRTWSGHRWRPTEVRVTWRRSRPESGGEWSAWQADGEVRGPRLISGGVDGRLISIPIHANVVPAEVAEFVDAVRPEVEA